MTEIIFKNMTNILKSSRWTKPKAPIIEFLKPSQKLQSHKTKIQAELKAQISQNLEPSRAIAIQSNIVDKNQHTICFTFFSAVPKNGQNALIFFWIE